jgi:hypothetical protein
MEATINIQVGDWPMLAVNDDGSLRLPIESEQLNETERRILDGLKRGRLYAVRDSFDADENVRRIQNTSNRGDVSHVNGCSQG